MSVRIVSADTTAKIADLIYRVAHWGYEQERFTFYNRSIAFIHSIWGNDDQARKQRIYEALQALNRNSYNTRYADCLVKPFIDKPYEYSRFSISEEYPRGTNAPGDYQKLKSVQYFLYQCGGHDNSPEAVQMYGVVMEIVDGLIHNIIINTPEYQQAVWG